MGVKVATLAIEIVGDAVKFEKTINNVVRSSNRFAGRIKRMGMDMTQGFTLPIAGAGFASLKWAGDMAKGMADVSTLIGGDIARTNELKQAAMDLRVQFNKSTADITKGMYDTVSAFGDSKDAVGQLGIVAKASVAGVSDTKDSLALLSSVTKGYSDTTIPAMRKASDLAFLAVREGQTTFGELASSIGKAVPWAEKMRVSQEELFSGFAALTGVTGNTAEVSTQLASLYRSLADKEAPGLSKALKALGYDSAETLIQERGLQGALKALISTTDGSAGAVKRMLGRAEGAAAALGIAGTQSEKFANTLEMARNASGLTDEAFKAQTKGVNKLWYELGQLQKRLQNLVIRFGDQLAPTVLEFKDQVVIPLVQKIEGWVEAFGRLTPEAKRVAFGIVGVTAAIGPMLLALGSVQLAVGQLVRIVPKLTWSKGLWKKATALNTTELQKMAAAAEANKAPLTGLDIVGHKFAKRAKGIATATGGAIKALMGMPLPITLGIAAVVLAIGIWKKWGTEIKKWVHQAYVDVKTWVQDKIGPIWEWVKGALGKVVGFYVDYYTGVFNVVKSVYETVKNWLIDKLGPVFDFVIEAVQKVGAPFVWLYNTVATWLGKAKMEVEAGLEKIGEFAEGAKDKVKELAPEVGKGVAGFASGVVEGLGMALDDTGDLLEQLTGPLGEKLRAIMDRMKGMLVTAKQAAEETGEAAEEATEKVTVGAGKAEKKSSSWADHMKQYVQGIRESTEGWFQSFEDGLVDTVMTGKANFKDFADSVIRDLIRIQVRAAFMGPFKGWISNLLGGSSEGETAPGAGAGGEAIDSPVGGDVGPQYASMGAGGGSGAGITVNVYDMAGVGVDVGQPRSDGAGGLNLDITIFRRMVAGMMDAGELDRPMRRNWGLARVGVGR